MEGANDRVARFEDRHRVADGLGDDAAYRVDKAPKRMVVGNIVARERLYANAPVGRNVAFDQRRRQVVEGHRLGGAEGGVELAQALGERAEQAAFEHVERRARFVETVDGRRQAPHARLERRLDTALGEPLVERRFERAERGAALAFFGRRQHAARWPAHEERQLLDQRELVVLALGHVVADGHDAVDLVECLEAGGERLGLFAARGEHLERPRRRTALGQEVAQRGHRLGLRVVQVERVEVEADLRQQRYRQHRRGERPHTHRPAGRRRQPGKARDGPRDARVRTRRVGAKRHQFQQRGKNGDVGYEADEHAGARDEAELRNARVIGGDEHVESCRRRRRAQEQGAADLVARADERLGRRATVGDQLAVAQAHMNAEVDAKADEQHGERHRDEVELADGQRREAGGPDEPDEQRDERREDQPQRTQADEQHDGDEDERDRRGDLGALLGALQLLVVEGDAARETHANAFLGDEPEVRRQPAHRLHRLLLRLQDREVEARLNEDQAATIRGRRGLAADHLAPRQVVATALDGGVDGVAEAVERLGGIEPRRFTLAQDFDGELELGEQAAQAGVPGQRGDQRLHLGEVVGEVLELFEVEVEKAVYGEELAAARAVDGLEQGFLLFEPRGEGGRRVLGEVGGLGVDHHHEHVVELGKGPVVVLHGLAERQLLGDHVLGVGVHSQVVDGVDEDRGRRGEGEGEHPSSVAAGAVDPAKKKPAEHVVGKVIEPVAHGAGDSRKG